MKTILYIIFSSFIITSCNRIEEIPENDLKLIIEETILTTAVISKTKPIADSVKNMDYYSPILDKYGYTVEDLEYTISQMIRRKTPVLSTILGQIESSIGTQKQGAEYMYEMYDSFLKKIDSTYVDTLYTLTTPHKFEKYNDLDSENINIPLSGNGEYKIKVFYSAYNIPSNDYFYTNFKVSDSLAKTFVGYSSSRRFLYYPSKPGGIYNSSIEFKWKKEDGIRGNYINLNILSNKRIDGFSNKAALMKHKRKKLNVTIDSITIVKTPDYKDVIRMTVKDNFDYNSVENYFQPVQSPTPPFTLNPVSEINSLKKTPKLEEAIMEDIKLFKIKTRLEDIEKRKEHKTTDSLIQIKKDKEPSNNPIKIKK